MCCGPAQGHTGLCLGPSQPLTPWASLSKGGHSLGLSLGFCEWDGYQIQAPTARPGDKFSGSSRKCGFVSGRSHPYSPDPSSGSLGRTFHCHRAWVREPPAFACSPLCNLRPTPHSLSAASPNGHNYAEPSQLEPPLWPPQLQRDWLNLTSGANFNPLPEWGEFPRLGCVAPALMGPWGWEQGPGPEIPVPRWLLICSPHLGSCGDMSHGQESQGLEDPTLAPRQSSPSCQQGQGSCHGGAPRARRSVGVLLN